MASNVVRIDEELKKEIDELQRQVAQDTGKWISQAEALRRLLEK